jgi:hypothetical protein
MPKAVYKKRITILERTFLDLGYQGMDARIRARVMYYTKSGATLWGSGNLASVDSVFCPFYLKTLIGLPE